VTLVVNPISNKNQKVHMDSPSFTADGSNGSGNCWGNEDYKFIGIKIKKEDSYAYAWIKLALKTEDKNLEIIIDSFGSRE